MEEPEEKRVTGFEPVVSTLGKSHVTATLNPHTICALYSREFSLTRLHGHH